MPAKYYEIKICIFIADDKIDSNTLVSGLKSSIVKIMKERNIKGVAESTAEGDTPEDTFESPSFISQGIVKYDATDIFGRIKK